MLRLRDLLGLSLESIVDLAQAEEARAALRDEWENDPSDADRMRIIETATPLIEKQLELVCARQKTLAKFARDLKERLRLIEEISAELEAKDATEAGEVQRADGLRQVRGCMHSDRQAVPYASAVPTCERCGRENPDEARFCNGCGAQLARDGGRGRRGAQGRHGPVRRHHRARRRSASGSTPSG